MISRMTVVMAAFAVFLFTGNFPGAVVRAQTIAIPAAITGTEDQYAYFVGLLEMALAETADQYGEATLVVSEAPMLQARQKKALYDGKLHVSFAVTSEQMEKDFQAVYFPVIAGLYGYRVFLVAKSTNVITRDSTLDMIKSLRAVQGRTWRDTEVLRENGFNVHESDYNSGFKLLSDKLVDVYPRSITEVHREVEFHTSLTLEPHHVMFYPNVVYFFAHKEQKDLAARIEQGLIQLHQQGRTFDYLQSQPFFQLARASLKDRQLHRLSTQLSEETEKQARHPFIQQVRAELGLAFKD